MDAFVTAVAGTRVFGPLGDDELAETVVPKVIRKLTKRPRMKRTALYYFFMVTALGLGIFFILRAGNQLPAPSPQFSIQSGSQVTSHLTAAGDYSFSAAVESNLWDNANDPLTRLFLQLFVVTSVSYLVGWIFTRFGQPAVVGEMMAGVLLGPSVFGLLAPAAFQFVFATSPPGRAEALKPNWGLSIHVYRRYGNGCGGAAPRSAYSSRSQPYQHHRSLFSWRAAGAVPLWPARSTWGLIY